MTRLILLGMVPLLYVIGESQDLLRRKEISRPKADGHGFLTNETGRNLRDDEQRLVLDVGLPGRQSVTQIEGVAPSPRCRHREEWQETCRLWSGRSHHRYLELNRLVPREGMGASLLRVAWALRHAILFDLEPVFDGPLLAGHGTGDFGDFVGLTHNPLLAIQDPAAFARATVQNVPFPEGNDDIWFREQENRTSVVYHADAMHVKKAMEWGTPISPRSQQSRRCRYAHQALRDMFWSAPRDHGRCRTFLHDETDAWQSTGYPHHRKRPWVLAVHVRRGDMVKFRDGARSVPQRYFSAAVRSVLRGIAGADPAAQVSVLVFSEGPSSMDRLQLRDENGKAFTWDIGRESCVDIGLNCSQQNLLRTNVFDTFDCLAAADVIVGSDSSFSEAAAAVSTNVKVMLYANQTEQDRVFLDSEAAASSGTVSLEEQAKMDTAISAWWHCSEYARQSAGSYVGLAASRFYQTVDTPVS
ncbi:unnamed protein product [Scytosiphon promiscuus]